MRVLDKILYFFGLFETAMYDKNHNDNIKSVKLVECLDYTGLDEADVPGPEAGEVGVVLPQPRDRARRYGLHRRAEPHRGVGVGAAAWGTVGVKTDASLRNAATTAFFLCVERIF